MARRTSLEAWRAINQNGLLSKRRLEVYNVVFDFGPLTSAEAFRILNQNKPMGAITSSRARFTELRDAGVFYEVRERFCNATGRLAIEWDVTENLPIKKKSENASNARTAMVADLILRMNKSLQEFSQWTFSMNNFRGIPMVPKIDWMKKLELIQRSLVESPRYQRDESALDDAIFALQNYITQLEKENKALRNQIENMYD